MKAVHYLTFTFCMVFYPLTFANLVKQAHLSSDWYPTNKTLLKKKLNRLAQTAAQQYNAQLNPAQIRALIVPHAAYSYSGAVATSVYRLLKGAQIKRIIILAPDHSVSFTGIALPQFDTYQTPLGVCTVDTSVVKKLADKPLFHTNNTLFSQEHALEIQLPLIQTYLPHSARIVPLIVGKLTCEQTKSIAQSLQTVIDAHTIVVVSTDFIHYGPRFQFTPFTDHITYRIHQLNSQAIEYIQQGICHVFAQFMDTSHATICGRYGLQILLALMHLQTFGTIEPRLIAYQTSEEQTTADENSVSYVGMLFTQERLETRAIEQQLTQYEQRALVQEAQDVLTNLSTHVVPLELLYPIKSFALQQAHGAFTTLYKTNGQTKELRGCIGRITTTQPLYKTVALVTEDAALHDPRFNPVEQTELPNISIQVSVLSQPRSIKSYKNIRLGTDGVILYHQGSSALFLPEVATEFHWTRDQMLQQLSEKAGLPADAWQDTKTEFKVFSTLDIH